MRNESDEKTRIVIELKRGEAPRVVMNKLFKHTQLESSFGVIRWLWTSASRSR
ncbi:MAG: hypothetical protein ACLUKN_12900 [Bacilli bacterium]